MVSPQVKRKLELFNACHPLPRDRRLKVDQLFLAACGECCLPQPTDTHHEITHGPTKGLHDPINLYAWKALRLQAASPSSQCPQERVARNRPSRDAN